MSSLARPCLGFYGERDCGISSGGIYTRMVDRSRHRRLLLLDVVLVAPLAVAVGIHWVRHEIPGSPAVKQEAFAVSRASAVPPTDLLIGPLQTVTAELSSVSASATALPTDVPIDNPPDAALATNDASPTGAANDSADDPSPADTAVPDVGEPTDQAAPDAPPTASPVAAAPKSLPGRTVGTAYLRSSPSTAAMITGSLPPGVPVTVMGCAANCTWLLVQSSAGSASWSLAFWFSVAGSVGQLGSQ